MAEEQEGLAWVVLRAVNRTQAKGTTVRIIVPRDPEVAEELGMDLTDARLLSVEEYLLDHGYVAPANIGLTWGTYTITPAGLRWLEASLPEPSPTDQPGEEPGLEPAVRAELEEERRRREMAERERDDLRRELEVPQEPRESPETAEASSVEPTTPSEPTEGPQEGAQRRSWWSRMFGA